MYKYVFLFLLIPQFVIAIEIPKEARVKNIGNYCTWSTLDTLAKTHKISKLEGILEARRKKNNYHHTDAGYDNLIEAELKERGVKFEIKPQWSYDRSLLEKYASTHGVAIALKDGNPWSGGVSTYSVRYTDGSTRLQYYYWGCHMILITDYNDKTVSFYDSSRPLDSSGNAKIWSCGREWFDQYWLGNSVVVFPDE